MNPLAAILFLRIKNAVTAIACTLPLALLLLVYHLAYSALSTGFLHTSGHPCELVAGIVLLALLLTTARILKYRRAEVCT